MVKNHIIKAFKIDGEMDNLIKECCEQLGFKRNDLIRFLLNRSLKQLKASAIKANGFENLDFSIRG